MPVHGNSHKNKNKHHLYGIYDRGTRGIYKYGISDNPVESDGYSRRLRSQVNLFNRVVGWLRFFGRILVFDIPGRKRAEELEDIYIEAHKRKKGYRPRGNPSPKQKGKRP